MRNVAFMRVVAIALGLGIGTAVNAEDASATTPGKNIKAAADLAPLGSPDFYPSPEHPVGWRGDGSGRFPGATPPTVWSRRPADITSEIMVQAVKPNGKPGPDSHVLEYFTVKDWLVAGPFPAADPEKDIETDFLGGEAEVQPDAGAKAGEHQWKKHRAYEGSQCHINWNNNACANLWVDFNYVFGTRIPEQRLYSDLDQQAAYAHTYLYSPRPADVDLAILYQDLPAVKLWVNGTPQRAQPRKGVFEDKGDLKIHLNEGWNRLLVKAICDKSQMKRYLYGQSPSQWRFAAYICPAGIRQKYAGGYETKNIAWMLKLTGLNKSQPIVVGEKLFVASGDADLLCLDKKSGKILWMHTVTYWDAMTAEERAVVKDQAEPLLAELDKVNAELIALLNANITPQGLDGIRQAVIDQELYKRYKFLKTLHASLSTGRKGKLYVNEWASSGNATPTSDGKHVYWVVQGDGGYLTSAFDVNGKLVWSNFFYNKDTHGHGAHHSPALCEGKLFVITLTKLIAYDAATGKELWSAPEKEGTATSPIRVQFKGRPALQTMNNLVSLDGEVLAEGGYGGDNCYVPVVEDGVLYNPSNNREGFYESSFEAIALPKQVGDKHKVIWKLDQKTIYGELLGFLGTGYIASPLYVDGFIYQVDASGFLVVIDTREKKLVYQRYMDGYNFNARYFYGYCASPTLAGKNIYLMDEVGYVTILKPGSDFAVVGNNVLQNVTKYGPGHLLAPCWQEPINAGMYFDGKRMFVHGDEYLYCIEEK